MYRIFDWFERYILMPMLFIIVLMLVVCLISVPFMIYEDCKRETFSLKKDEWVCKEYLEHNRIASVLVGKVIVNQVRHTKECVNYIKRSE